MSRYSELKDMFAALAAAQPPATPQEPAPQKNLAVLTLRAQQAERAYDRLNLCSDHRDKATGRCIVCDGEERSRRAFAPPAVWQDIEPIRKKHVRDLLATRGARAAERRKHACSSLTIADVDVLLRLLPSPPTPGEHL